MNRRDFIGKASAATGAVVLSSNIVRAKETGNDENKMAEHIEVQPTFLEGEMIYRMLGNTGERVSAIGMGGFHMGKHDTEAESINLIRTGIERGITFLDNCWDYHDGLSEIREGKALRDGYRSKVFLMTKIDGRDKKTAAKQIDESLLRLQTDHVDLMQFHEIIRMEDPDKLFAEGGAFEAMMDAKKSR